MSETRPCAECGKPYEDSRHIRFGPDQENPVKHIYTPASQPSEPITQAHSMALDMIEKLQDERDKLQTELWRLKAPPAVPSQADGALRERLFNRLFPDVMQLDYANDAVDALLPVIQSELSPLREELATYKEEFSKQNTELAKRILGEKELRELIKDERGNHPRNDASFHQSECCVYEFLDELEAALDRMGK